MGIYNQYYLIDTLVSIQTFKLRCYHQEDKGIPILHPYQEVLKIVQSREGNGHKEPEIEKTYEHLDAETQTVQDRWVETDEETGDRQIIFGDEVREKLGIEEQDDPESDE